MLFNLVALLFLALFIYFAATELNQQEQRVVNIDGVREDNPSTLDYVNSVVQALTSRNLLLRVIEANNLRANEAFAPSRGTPYSDVELADLLEEKVVVKLRRLTRLVEITAQDPDPELARDLAASFVKEFLRENFAQKMSVTQVANDFLQEEAEKLKARLEESERKLQTYKENNQAVSLPRLGRRPLEELRADTARRDAVVRHHVAQVATTLPGLPVGKHGLLVDVATGIGPLDDPIHASLFDRHPLADLQRRHALAKHPQHLVLDGVAPSPSVLHGSLPTYPRSSSSSFLFW